MSNRSPATVDREPGPTGYLLDHRWHVRPDINRVFDGDTEHQVPDKFMQVLVALINHPGVVSRQKLFDTVWPETFVVDESLTRAISSLRKLFDDDPKHPRIIETIPKKGYRLLVPVEPVTDTNNDETPIARTTGSPPRRTVRYAMVVAAVLVAIGGAWLALREQMHSGGEPRRIQVTALPGIEEYPALAPAGDRVAFVWDGDDAEPDGVFVQVIGAGPALRLTDAKGHYAFPAWTHDSRFIAYARLTGTARGIFMVPATGGSETELVAARADELLTAPDFSSDGRWLVFSRREAPGLEWQVRRKNLDTGSIDTLAPSNEIPYGGYRPRCSPDGEHVAFLRLDTDRRVVVISTIDGSPSSTAAFGSRSIADFDWAPNGAGLAISSDEGITLVDLDGTVDRTLSATTSVGALSAAASRPVLAYSRNGREKNIWRWSPPSDLAGQSSVRIIHSTMWDAMPALSPDGRRVAFLSDRTGQPGLWVANDDGSGARMVTQLEGVRWLPPSWSPDGQRVALTVDVDGTPTTCLVEVAGGHASCLAAPPGGETYPTWSHDGTALYITRKTHDGDEIWRRSTEDTDGGDASAIIRGGAYRAAEAADGSALYYTRGRRTTEIWRSDPDGRDPVVAFSLDGGEILTWRVTRDGLYVGSRREIGDRRYRVVHLDFETGVTTEILEVPGRLGFELDVDPRDGRSLVFDQTEAIAADIFAIEDY